MWHAAEPRNSNSDIKLVTRETGFQSMEHSKGDRRSLPWLCCKSLFPLSCYQTLLPSLLAHFDDAKCYTGEDISFSTWQEREGGLFPGVSKQLRSSTKQELNSANKIVSLEATPSPVKPSVETPVLPDSLMAVWFPRLTTQAKDPASLSPHRRFPLWFLYIESLREGSHQVCDTLLHSSR